MKKGKFLFLVMVVTLLFGVARVFAQVTEPPLTLPFDSNSSTPTPTATATQSTVAVATTTATATTTPTSIVEDAETGPEIYILIALSLLGGLGLFSIKKHFDLKRFRF